MKRKLVLETVLCCCFGLMVSGCGKAIKAESQEPNDTGPHAAVVEPDMDANHFKVQNQDRFPCAEAVDFEAAPELNATGVVSPDVSKQVPVISLASGRIVEVKARLGDTVRKGQLLFKVRSTDIAQAYSDYQKALANEQLTKVQLNRAQLLFEHGAAAKSALEIAQNAEANAQVDVETAREHLRLLGSDPDHPSPIVPVYAPISGVITDQQVTAAAGVQALSSPSPFTISDVSDVWILCDVYENDLPQVRLGEYADIHLNAYPGLALKGRIGNIGEILDPNIRTAKVRLEVSNRGLMRLGMFVTATFHGPRKERHVMVPASAVLHLRDRDWVYTPTGDGMFRRVEVAAGNMEPGNMQEIVSGITAGTQVVRNALVLQNTVEQ